MNPLAKVFIDFQLISDNISERWLIPIEILAITTLLAVVEGEIGLISS
jgi:NADH:ubiquinone oxidoreductase subunit 6 (subunit J)